MKNLGLMCLIALLSLFTSCKSTKNGTQNADTSNKKYDEKTFDPYFRGLGAEPFWDIEISNDFIVYKDLDGKKEVFPVTDIQKVQDANIQTIVSEKGDKKVHITISQQKCSDGMSENEFDYKITVEISGKENQNTLNGCGNFRVSNNLSGKWELNYFKGEEIPANKYLKTPYLEFQADEKSISGNASCNGINGGIFIQNETLRFSNVASTRVMCVHENMESAFLAELPKITNYKIENDELHLYSGNELLMKFKKV